MVARWRPVHRVHAAILRGLRDRSEQVVIGIGSSNRYNAANPFTAAETARCIGLVLGEAEHVQVLEVPDLGDGPRWAEMVRELFGPLDLFVTANVWVRDLVAAFWPVVHPIHFVPPDERAPISGTLARVAMARGDDWARLVPPEVARQLRAGGLVERLRREFGDKIITRHREEAGSRYGSTGDDSTKE